MEKITGLVIVLISMVVGLVGVVYAILTARLTKVENKVENKVEDHEKRVQKLEDTTVNQIKDLKVEIKEFKSEINIRFDKIETNQAEMLNMVHKEKNVEQQMQNTLQGLLEFLNARQK
jgi:TolA-binding protein